MSKNKDKFSSKNGPKVEMDDVSNFGLQYISRYLIKTNFEALRHPATLKNTNPLISLGVNANIRKIPEQNNLYEVRFRMNGTGTIIFRDEQKNEETKEEVYKGDIDYGGLFSFSNDQGATEDQKLNVLKEEATSELYHDARGILLGLVRDAGFSEVTLQPLDFKKVWRDAV